MHRALLGTTFALLVLPTLPLRPQHVAEHEPPDKLGEVSFPISCSPAVQKDFNRGVALLHSFSYASADQVFRSVAQHDSRCAIAHWGIAMTRFHQLWQPHILPDAAVIARQEVELGLRIGAKSELERQFLRGAGLIFQSDDSVPYESRALQYEQAMGELAARNPKRVEVQIFYALALLANASPADKTHGRQKHAAALLEPLFRSFPEHPGIAHYLIHAYDNSELAPKGLRAARLYSKIAPSAPHALHMPSHIFTRLGLWQDSIDANTAARSAARHAGDIGEELHDMDYLAYAYLQLGQEANAAQVVSQLRSMSHFDSRDFKSAYAATAIPIRYIVERADWSAASEIAASTEAPPEVAAASFWAQGLGFARTGRSVESRQPVQALERLEQQLHSDHNEYWATQVRVMRREVLAWTAHAQGSEDEAAAFLRQASDEEGSLEKLPVTPGPIIPAREQLGTLLLEQGHPDLAIAEFKRALADAPGRRGSIRGVELATQRARKQ